MASIDKTYDIMNNLVSFAFHERSKLKFFGGQIWLFLVITYVTTSDLVKKSMRIQYIW